jgi:hypothetical protein
MSLVVKIGYASEQQLKTAYDKAGDELVNDYKVQRSALDSLVKPMTKAISDLYNAGERNVDRLADYAVYRALQNIGWQ